jgi:hypothetical protein
VIFPLFYGFGAAMAAQAPTKNGPPTPIDTLIWETIFLICLLVTIGIALWLVRTTVFGDSRGLRWRGIGPWKSVCWEEVEDYYEKTPRLAQRSSDTTQATVVSLIVASVGKVGVTNLWSNSEALRELIKRQATQAKAQEWGVVGCRPCDTWPQVFDYNTLENRWAPRLWFKLFLTFVVYLLIKPVMQLSSMAGLIGWTMTLMTAGLYLLLVGSCGLIFLIPLAQYRAAGRRKKERITATLNGIMFEDDGRRVEAAWAEVIRYGIGPGLETLTSRYVVETQQGDFDFLVSIKQATLLKAIIQRYAAEADDQEWRPHVNPEALGGEAARWSGGQVGVGARVYHHRTRMHRALLWLPATLGLTMLFLAILAGQGLPLGGNVAYFLSFGGVMGLVFLGGWYAYRTCRIETDEDGLARITPLGRRRLLWNQVEQYCVTREGIGILEGRGERLRFGKEIVGYDELRAEIARRITQGKENPA